MTIDDEQVIFDEDGWLCSCRTFEDFGRCEHCVKAAALRTVQQAAEMVGSSATPQ